jgi:hypothetical protein
LIALGVVVAICFSQYRIVKFDLTEKKVYVTILGTTIFQRPFAEFERFSFDLGYVVNGIDPGGILYMHFKTGPKMRLQQLRDPDDIRKIQFLIIEFMGMKV